LAAEHEGVTGGKIDVGVGLAALVGVTEAKAQPSPMLSETTGALIFSSFVLVHAECGHRRRSS
jgi:hypothetical protein